MNLNCKLGCNSKGGRFVVEKEKETAKWAERTQRLIFKWAGRKQGKQRRASHLLRIIQVRLIQRGLGHEINETWRALQAMSRCWEKTAGLCRRVTTPYPPPPTCSVAKVVFEKKKKVMCACVSVKRVCERERVMDSMHTKW